MTPVSAVGEFVDRMLTLRLSLPVVISSLLLSGAIFIASLQLLCPLTHERTESLSGTVKAISDSRDSGSNTVSSLETSISAAPVSGVATAHQRPSYRSTAEYRWTFEVEACRTCPGRGLACDERGNGQLSPLVTQTGMKRPTLVTLGIRLQA